MDIGHLRYVHGYDNVNPVGSVTVEGAYLKSCFDFKRVRRVLGVTDLVYEVSAVTHIHGLGYSYVEIRPGCARPTVPSACTGAIAGSSIRIGQQSDWRDIRCPMCYPSRFRCAKASSTS